MLNRIHPGRWRRWLGCAVLALLAACDTDDAAPTTVQGNTPLPEETRDAATPRLSSVQGSAPSLAVCGTASTYVLWAGKYFPGTVAVSNDAENLYVTYEIDRRMPDWFVSDTRLSVTRNIASIPQDRNRLPDPWSFPFSAVNTPPTKAYTYTLPLATNGWKANDRLVVAASAGVVHPKGASWEGPWEWLTGWGVGVITGRTVNDLANYTVQRCPNAPPPPPPPAPSQGAISITFDDGMSSVYERAFPVLKEFGLVANAAVNPLPIDSGWGGYMWIDEVKALHNAGWTIVSHSMTHPEMRELSDSALHWELAESQKWIVKHGFRGPHIFVVPFHRWGERERIAAMRYYKAVRGYNANQFSPIRMVKYPVTQPYDLTAFEPEFAPWTTVEGRQITREYLDRAVKNGEYIDILFHRIPEKDLATFRELIAIIAQYKPYIRTYDQIIPR